jgi:hypothetical protein
MKQRSGGAQPSRVRPANERVDAHQCIVWGQNSTWFFFMAIPFMHDPAGFNDDVNDEALSQVPFHLHS